MMSSKRAAAVANFFIVGEGYLMRYWDEMDSLDMMGNEFDYNGIQEGTGEGEKFSLKIRAFKEPSWLSDPKYQNVVLCDKDEVDKNGKVVKKVRSRGLFDTFILPYAYFLVYCEDAFKWSVLSLLV